MNAAEKMKTMNESSSILSLLRKEKHSKANNIVTSIFNIQMLKRLCLVHMTTGNWQLATMHHTL